jgi:hypothetical protein
MNVRPTRVLVGSAVLAGLLLLSTACGKSTPTGIPAGPGGVAAQPGNAQAAAAAPAATGKSAAQTVLDGTVPNGACSLLSDDIVSRVIGAGSQGKLVQVPDTCEWSTTSYTLLVSVSDTGPWPAVITSQYDDQNMPATPCPNDPTGHYGQEVREVAAFCTQAGITYRVILSSSVQTDPLPEWGSTQLVDVRRLMHRLLGNTA